jgi:hypothetical protein
METEGIPKVNGSIFRKPCCLGECAECTARDHGQNSIYQCPRIFDANIEYKWKEFSTVMYDNGNEAKELVVVRAGLEGFRMKFQSLLERYKKHYFQYRWLNLCRRLDVVNLGEFQLFIMTDYSAQPVLDSQDKLNSVGHGVCVLSCWVVLHSPQRRYYENNLGQLVPYTYYECDHIRVVTPSTGKQKDQDWFLHCKIFDMLIHHYKAELNITDIVLWTDGAPNQYKNRYVFYWISQAERRHGVTIRHSFGATAQFKGVHDKVGQVAKWIVR